MPHYLFWFRTPVCGERRGYIAKISGVSSPYSEFFQADAVTNSPSFFHSSLKKEEFYLNRKRVQKSEVMSLLESAGFSKSNPYYIVQQGKVANLCVMKDKDRLNLLKEVAGTTVYEERRAESVKIMLDTANKKEKVEVRWYHISTI